MKIRMDDCNTLAKVPEKLWGLWQKWIDGDAFWPDRVVVVNGDIYHPHLFVDATISWSASTTGRTRR